MCLSWVDSKWKGLSRKVETGYKIFALFPPTNQLKFIVFSHNGHKNVETGKWLISRLDLVDGFNRKYRAGFHIWKNKVEAERIMTCSTHPQNQRMVEVKYKGVLAKGNQSGREVVVARHMQVPRRRNKI